MKKNRKIYDRIFKEKAVQLSHEIHNISELARELSVSLHNCINGEKSTKRSDKEVSQLTAI